MRISSHVYRVTSVALLLISSSSCVFGYSGPINYNDPKIFKEVSEAAQRGVAIHESAHAIAHIWYTGDIHDVRSITVHTRTCIEWGARECCDALSEPHYGTADVDKTASPSISHYRGLIMMYYAGPEAARVIGRLKSRGRIDIKRSTKVAWKIQNLKPRTQAKSRWHTKYSPKNAPRRIREAVLDELASGKQVAEEFVRLNADLIVDVADALLAEPAFENRRRLYGSAFRRIVRDRVIKSPLTLAKAE